MDDHELEQTMRAGLERRAAGAEVDLAVVDRARRAARGRRTSRLAVLGAAAAVVVTVGVTVGVTAAVGGDGPRAEVADRSAPDVTDQPVRSEGPGETDVRTERWGDVQVDVPASWGYGAAPAGTLGDAVTCYPGASLDATGAPVRAADEATTPYVGRPIGYTDVCVPYPDNRPDAPATDYVWLGAAVAPGVVALDNGLVQETVEREGTTVTVATSDPGLRQRILGSVTGGETCLSELDRSDPIAHDGARDPDAAPATLRVCAYRLVQDREPWQLTYAADLGRQALSDYLAAVAAGDPPTDQCPTIDYQLTSAVLLEVLDTDGGVLRQDAVNPMQSCAGVAVGANQVWEFETSRLTEAMTRPWVVGGVGAVVQGSPAFGFIGPQG